MPFVTPQEIEKKAASAYSRFLRRWIRGDASDFFPLRLKVNLGLDVANPKSAIAASGLLDEKSKAQRRWGYTVHREQVRKRGFGSNMIPKAVTIDSLEDLLKLAEVTDHFSATELVANRVRQELPGLEDWLVASALTVYKLEPIIDGLIAVTEFFLRNPTPDCYARQIPVSVDSKFILRNKATLRQWFDLLLPASAIDVNESKFERRFGLRDGRPHRALRLLDSQLLAELGLPFDELSLPLSSIAKLPVQNTTVFVVENDLNLLTLPMAERTIAIRGEGNAVNRLEGVSWLRENRIIYWGDIDAEGFVILSRLRNIFPDAESVMMNLATLDAHSDFIIDGTGAAPPIPTNLTSSESEAMQRCLQSNCRLEQEKIIQTFVDNEIQLSITKPHHIKSPIV